MRAAVIGEWVVVTGGWNLFRSMREQVLTPETARQAATWCEGFGDFESASELLWAAREAEKFCPEPEDGQHVGQADDIIDIIERIDEVLSVDSMSWSPVPEDEKKRILAGEQDERPREWVNLQIHAIPVEQVSEWRGWWDGLSEADQADTPWYIVCHTHKVVGERSVTCGCGNPSGQGDSR
ncbi:Uncharacterised protein [Mycobacteroides abscessus subsp. massiliense]|nr:Uncharacterised protein [Mycobacteroides abscessus subsp. massiliense]